MSTVTNKLHANESASTTQKAASIAHDAIDHAAEKAEPLEQKVREQAHLAQDRISATSAEANEQIHQQVEKVEAFEEIFWSSFTKKEANKQFMDFTNLVIMSKKKER